MKHILATGRKTKTSNTKTHRVAHIALCLAVALSFPATAVQAEDAPNSSLERILSEWEGQDNQFLHDFYAANGYQYAWDNSDNVEDALELIEASKEDGLEPEYFQLSKLQALKKADDREAFDIQLTESIAELATALRFGILDQDKYIDGGLSARKDIRHPVKKLQEALQSESLKEAIHAQRPTLSIYDKLRATLKKYREIDAHDHPELIAPGSSLHKGDSGTRVNQLIARLHDQGYLSDEPLPTKFSDAVENAVKALQTEHGITADGVVGKDTLDALNITPAERIATIRANMERVRWLGKLPAGRAIVVNIPRFHVEVLDDKDVTWSGRVIVGAEYTKTPIFRDQLQYVEFNPTWTVPRSIIRRSLAKKILDDPKYLEQKHFYLAKANGQQVDPASVDWSSLTPHSFPYWVVQKPGPHNALGRVKFIFPNAHSVYLHDTPNKALFDKNQRTFSHGCIRLQKPLELAEVLLGKQGWDKTKIDEVIASEKTTRVNLDTQIPIIIGYWTVDYEDNELRFINDVYDRDATLIAALNKIQ